MNPYHLQNYQHQNVKQNKTPSLEFGYRGLFLSWHFLPSLPMLAQYSNPLIMPMLICYVF